MDSNAREWNADGKWSLTTMRPPSLNDTGPTCRGTATCARSEPTTSPESISSAAGSPARTSATQASEPGSTGRVPVFGPSSRGSFASFDPGTSSLRTSQLCLGGERSEFSGTLPPSGTMRSGRLYARPTWVRPTAEPASSSWPTPDASVSAGYNQSESPNAAIRPALAALAKMWPTPEAANARNTRNSTANRKTIPPTGIHAGNTPIDAITLWPTPRSSDNENRTLAPSPSHGNTHGRLLAAEAGAWPIPTARDWRSDQSRKTDEEQYGTRGRPLPRVALLAGPLGRQVLTTGTPGLASSPIIQNSLPRSQRKRLSPLFVEWLMGFPTGWTVCDASATPSSRKSPSGSAAASSKRKERK